MKAVIQSATIFVLFMCSSYQVFSFTYPPKYDSLIAIKVVNNLDLKEFKSSIKSLADMGNRWKGTSSNKEARDWLKTKLEQFGYTNVTLQSSYNNVYCTKVGTISPDSMFIISAHYDGVQKAQSANDDASGCALVLEGARVFADPSIKTHYSIRFAFWNEEETGLKGSGAYVRERRPLQGKDEPYWLGMVTHDMILYDHGMPPKKEQSPNADMDIEYRAGSTMEKRSKLLAEELFKGNKSYAKEYPAEIGTQMSNTDSDPFKNYTAAVSIRDLQRLSEIGKKADPTWHTNLDTYDYFSEKDFLLGYNTVQTSIGTMCRLLGVYDSATTFIKNNSFTMKQSLSKYFAPTKLIVFDIHGRKICQFVSSGSLAEDITRIKNHRDLSKGIYFIHSSTTKPQLNSIFHLAL